MKEELWIKDISIKLNKEGWSIEVVNNQGDIFKDCYKHIPVGARPTQLELEKNIPDEIERAIDNVDLYKLSRALRTKQSTFPRVDLKDRESSNKVEE